MPTTGQRGAHRPHPGNTTGMAFFRQQRVQDAKRKLADQSRDAADEARKQTFRAGFDAGHEAGFIAGWDALAKYLVDEGILMPDEDQGDEADED